MCLNSNGRAWLGTRLLARAQPHTTRNIGATDTHKLQARFGTRAVAVLACTQTLSTFSVRSGLGDTGGGGGLMLYTNISKYGTTHQATCHTTLVQGLRASQGLCLGGSRTEIG